jgi:hypothetical protein
MQTIGVSNWPSYPTDLTVPNRTEEKHDGGQAGGFLLAERIVLMLHPVSTRTFRDMSCRCKTRHPPRNGQDPSLARFEKVVLSKRKRNSDEVPLAQI